MSAQRVKENLLVGLAGVENGALDQETLVQAMRIWVDDKSQSFDDLLARQAEFSEEKIAALYQLADQRLQQHDQQVTRCLADMEASAELHQGLEGLGDLQLYKAMQLLRSAEVTQTGLEPNTSAAMGETNQADSPAPDHTSPWLATPADTPVDETMAYPTHDLEPLRLDQAADNSHRYYVLRPHARGGLGEVSVALDKELRREVALKEMHAKYAEDDRWRSRFLREAEITGRLEHPGVVPIYGVGTYPDGRPYYAMKFIRGETLEKALLRFHAKLQKGKFSAAEQAIEFRRLLNCVVAACNAMHYAHSRHIVHRDLKPANIMLGDYGETLVVDWGLAKEWKGKGSPPQENHEVKTLAGSYVLPPAFDTPAPEATHAGSVMGTPSYMSPEQAAGDSHRVGSAADVYSLGATLYHVLAGKAPFHGKAESGKSVLERVRKGDFPPPRERNSEVPKPLEAICLKAMNKNEYQRYSSAAELADELERWLADEPVHAWKEPPSIRASRWLRRHKTAVSAAAVALTSLCLGLALFLGVLASTNARIHSAKIAAEQQRDVARKNFRLARQAVESFFTTVSEEQLLHQPGMQGLRRNLLTQARSYHQQFVQQHQKDPEVQADVALSHFYLGRVAELLDSGEEALKLYALAEQMQRRLAEADKQPEYLKAWSDTLNAQGRTLQNSKRLEEGVEKLRQALQVREQLAEAAPTQESQRLLANAHMNLGLAERHRGDNSPREQDRENHYQIAFQQQKAAQQERRQALQSGREGKLLRDLGRGEYNLAVLEMQRGQWAEGIPRINSAVEIFRELEKAPTMELENCYCLADCLNMRGDLYFGLADQWDQSQAVDRETKIQEYLEGALRAYQESAERFRDLARQNPQVHKYQTSLARGMLDLAGVYRFQGDGPRALKNLQESARIFAKLAEEVPEADYQHDLAMALFAQAAILEKTAPKEAWEKVKQAQKLLVPLAKRLPQYRGELENIEEYLNWFQEQADAGEL